MTSAGDSTRYTICNDVAVSGCSNVTGAANVGDVAMDPSDVARCNVTDVDIDASDVTTR